MSSDHRGQGVAGIPHPCPCRMYSGVKTVPNGLQRSKTVTSGPKRSGTVTNGPERSPAGRGGHQWSATVRNGHRRAPPAFSCPRPPPRYRPPCRARKGGVSGKSVRERVDSGGCRILKKTKTKKTI